MKKYWRWIVFGLVAVGLVSLLLLVGTNKKLRQRVEALLLERFIRNKVGDLKDKAAITKAQAESGKITAEQAEKEASEINEKIKKQKESLQDKLKTRGMDSNEISNRFDTLQL